VTTPSEPLKLVSLFAGVGGFDIAAEYAGIEPAAACEIDTNARGVIAHQFPDLPLFTDVQELTADDLYALNLDPNRTVLTFGSPCFVAGTRILTERGWVPIEDVEEGEFVLTHLGRWRKVTAVMGRTSDHSLRVRGHGIPDIVTTDEHPFWARSREQKWDPQNRTHVRAFGEPGWTPAAKMSDQFASQVLPPVEDNEYPEDVWWVVGRFLADGWRSTYNKAEGKQRVTICCSHHEADELEAKLQAVFGTITRIKDRTVTKFQTSQGWFVDLVTPLGKGAANKTLTRRELALPPEKASALLDGYLSGDGGPDRGSDGEVRGRKATTVSRSLALSMALLAQRAFGVVARVYEQPVPSTTVIEGRTVNQATQYGLAIPNRNRSAFVEGDYGWKLIRNVERTDGPVLVYNISVDEDESYVADGAVVHNCQDLSIAGRRSGMVAGTGTRSSLFYEVVRILEDFPAQWIVWENVPGAFSSNQGRDFAAVVDSLVTLGYGISWRVLDAQYAGVPQRRRRVFVVGRLGDDGRAPGQVLDLSESRSGDSAPGRSPWPYAAARADVGAHSGSSDRPGDSGSVGERNSGVTQSVEAVGVLGETSHTLTAEGHDASEDGSGRGTPVVAATLTARYAKGTDSDATDTMILDGAPQVTPLLEVGARTGVSTTDPRAGIGIGEPGDPQFTLQASKQHGVAIASRDVVAALTSTGVGTVGADDNQAQAGHLVPMSDQEEGSDPIVFSSKDHGQDASDEAAPTLRAMGHHTSHMNGGGQLAVAFALRGRDEGAVPEVHEDGSTAGALRASSGGSSRDYLATSEEGQLEFAAPVSPTLSAGASKGCGRVPGIDADSAESLTVWGKEDDAGEPAPVPVASRVRRLTPLECERLQGFPDGWTRRRVDLKPGSRTEGVSIDQADSSRYKQMGNAVAVPVVTWILSRLAHVDAHTEVVAPDTH
jgi:site-specific DNA-cytosine methylase